MHILYLLTAARCAYQALRCDKGMHAGILPPVCQLSNVQKTKCQIIRPYDDHISHNNLTELWSVPVVMTQQKSSFGAEGCSERQLILL